MGELRVVNRGVDTLVINVYYTDLRRPIRREIDTESAVQLDEWKRLAQELSEPFITPWVFNNASLQMQPNGAGHGQWPWMLKTTDITLYISQGKWNGVGAVRLSSQYLWSCSGSPRGQELFFSGSGEPSTMRSGKILASSRPPL